MKPSERRDRGETCVRLVGLPAKPVVVSTDYFLSVARDASETPIGMSAILARLVTSPPIGQGATRVR
jgi:hypothetical protein